MSWSPAPPLDLRDLANADPSPTTLSQRIARNWQLVRTFPPGQVAARLRRRCQVKWGSFRLSAVPEVQLPVQPAPSLGDILPAVDLQQTHRSQDRFQELESGHLTLLNQTIEVGRPVDWRQSGASAPSHLWRFHLHYHEYLLDLIGPLSNSISTANQQLIADLIVDWTKHNTLDDRRVHQDAWHPYCLSRRLPVWILLRLTGALPASLPEVTSVDVLIGQQAEFLAQHLETDLRGNHLLENYFALAICGCYFGGPHAQRWRHMADHGWRRELASQLLPSGEHFERSPMYHAVIAGHLCNIALAASGFDGSLETMARQAVLPMLSVLAQLQMPDGEIPWFADSCAGEGPSMKQLRAWAERAGLPWPSGGSRRVGDYWIHRRDQDQLILDAGSLAAETLPAHGHADLLNIVGSIDGRRLLIDSGNGDYEDGADRRYARSSRAHNVLTIDGQDHADLWSKFRMGRRGRPGPLDVGQSGDFDWATAQHDAYRHLGVPWVRRWVACHRQQLFWICLDQIPRGQSKHQLEGYLHLSAEAECSDTPSENRQVWNIRWGQHDLVIGFLGASTVRAARGWDYPEFGKRQSHPAWQYAASSAESSLLGWYVCPAGDGNCQLVSSGDRPHLEFQIAGQPTQLQLG